METETRFRWYCIILYDTLLLQLVTIIKGTTHDILWKTGTNWPVSVWTTFTHCSYVFWPFHTSWPEPWPQFIWLVVRVHGGFVYCSPKTWWGVSADFLMWSWLLHTYRIWFHFWLLFSCSNVLNTYLFKDFVGLYAIIN